MNGYALQLLEDRLAGDGEVLPPLLPRNRVIYVVEGDVTITMDEQAREFTQNSAWFGAGPCSVRAGSQGARLWRWELVRTSATDDSIAPGAGVTSRLKHYEEVDLESQAKYLMRCDRVDFPLGGIAYTHTHRGPGIRCLLRGELKVRAKEHAFLIQPGDAWFEKGSDPVFATASTTHLTSFVRAMILPRSLKGRSSIRYVRLEDQDKPKTQQYTRFVDEFIEHS